MYIGTQAKYCAYFMTDLIEQRKFHCHKHTYRNLTFTDKNLHVVNILGLGCTVYILPCTSI